MHSSEQDLALFKSRLAVWQERYLAAVVVSYQSILDSDTTASNKFWKLGERVDRDIRYSALQLPYQMDRANVEHNLRALLKDGAIREADLEGFSEELRKAVKEKPTVQ